MTEKSERPTATHPFVVAVTLYVQPGQEEAFEKYEQLAFARIQGHRGSVLVRLRCSSSARGDEAPYEFHLLGFPSKAAFDAFLASGAPYFAEKERIFTKTLVVEGEPLTQSKGR